MVPKALFLVYEIKVIVAASSRQFHTYSDRTRSRFELPPSFLQLVSDLPLYPTLKISRTVIEAVRLLRVYPPIAFKRSRSCKRIFV